MTLARRRNRTPAVLILALLAGLVSMHGLTALVGPTHQLMPVAVISTDLAGGHSAYGRQPTGGASDGPHHGPAATGHHPCVAAPTAGVALAWPVDMKAAALPLSRRAEVGSPPARARADRAPPDLNDLSISRT